MSDIKVKTPWEKASEGIPMHLDYFQGSMYEAVEKVAKIFPRYTAISFMGRDESYAEVINNINKCARSLKTLGVREGDIVTIAMPN